MVQSTGLADLVAEAVEREAEGYDGLWTAEAAHDPFLPLMPVAEHTEHLRIGTAIAVAFARNPMSTAYTAYDLQTYSQGRFALGLGTQIEAHVKRRFSMPWSNPAPRMREYVAALRAIWHSWETGERLRFRGDFYSHTLMTPFFQPEPGGYGPPEVHLAAVGAHMTRVVGEVADGLLPHPFTTPRYLSEVTRPLLAEGAAKAGRDVADVGVTLSGFVVTGSTEERMAVAVRGTRKQIAFYGSTPAYKPVLELHGWGELADELHKLSRGREEERWDRMAELVDDEVLHTFAVVAEPDVLGAEIVRRWGGLVDRFQFYTPYPVIRDVLEPALTTLRGQG